MKLTENQAKCLQTCIQSIITALLLFIQGFYFSSCVSADNGSTVNVDKDTNVEIPVYIPEGVFDVGVDKYE